MSLSLAGIIQVLDLAGQTIIQLENEVANAQKVIAEAQRRIAELESKTAKQDGKLVEFPTIEKEGPA